MKDKIEHKFKELLENQELPYDSAAWDSMSKLLDQKSPVVKPTNFYRWLLGGAAITAIAISSYFIINSTEKTVKQKNTASNVKTQPNKVQNSTEQKIENNLRDIDQTKTTSNLKSNANSNEPAVVELDPIQTYTNNSNEPRIQEKQSQKNTSNEIIQSKNQTSPIVSQPNENNANLENKNETHTIVCKNVCVGEAQTLENKNDFKVLVVNQNTGDVVTTISANSKTLFEAKSNGNYALKANSSIIGSFEVTTGNKPHLEVESTITYVKGIPTIKASSSLEIGLSWFINNKSLNSTANEIEITPFKAGSYSISVCSTDNGCKVDNSQVVQIDEDYNLLAVNAFEPTSYEPKRQSFMPFALTQRDVKFTMIILDRRDGGVVYKTSDASMPWNGVDMRSGQLVDSGQDFIWKVQLVNPLPGESSEYKGIITKL
jgi:hypothetical protein